MKGSAPLSVLYVLRFRCLASTHLIGNRPCNLYLTKAKLAPSSMICNSDLRKHSPSSPDSHPRDFTFPTARTKAGNRRGPRVFFCGQSARSNVQCESRSSPMGSGWRGPPLLWSESFQPRDGTIKFVRTDRSAFSPGRRSNRPSADGFLAAHAGVFIVT